MWLSELIKDILLEPGPVLLTVGTVARDPPPLPAQSSPENDPGHQW